MKLSKEEADLFFKLMWGLQFYINGRHRILPGVESVEDFAKLPSESKIQVRDALWENPDLIDAYVKENPEGLSTEELDIVQKWSRVVSGTFQIYRLLKKHSIFIGGKGQVYGVLGLNDSLEDVFQGRSLPVMVKAVLLPFKGKIVYDGLLRWSNVYFGRGIRSSLHEKYMAAKQNDRIITTLEPELEQVGRRTRKKPSKDWRPVVDDLVKSTERMKGGPAVQSSVFTLVRASARLAQAAVHHPGNLDGLWHLEQQVRRALSRVQTTLDRAEQ